MILHTQQLNRRPSDPCPIGYADMGDDHTLAIQFRAVLNGDGDAERSRSWWELEFDHAWIEDENGVKCDARRSEIDDDLYDRCHEAAKLQMY